MACWWRYQKAGTGCFIGDNFLGVLAYANDITLLAPSASALRIVLVICDEYAFILSQVNQGD